MNYCPNCGEKIDGDSRFCKYCGTKLYSAVDPIPEHDSEFEPELESKHQVYVSTEKPKESGGCHAGCIVLGLIIAAVLVIIIAIVIATIGPESETNTDPGTDSETEAVTESVTEPETLETPELSEEEYKASCGVYTYEDIFRNPDKYKGQKAVFTGEVVQVMDTTFLGVVSYVYRVNVTEIKYDYIDASTYRDTMYIVYYPQQDEARVLEGDILTMWGELDGLETYKAIAGNEVTIPRMVAEYITINNYQG